MFVRMNACDCAWLRVCMRLFVGLFLFVCIHACVEIRVCVHSWIWWGVYADLEATFENFKVAVC